MAITANTTTTTAATAPAPLANPAPGDPNYTRSASNTSGTADQWAAGTNWDATPTSGTTAQLVFGGAGPTALAAGATIFTNNNIAGNFQLNIFNFTYSGPASGVQPTVTVSGNPLQFVSNSGTTPTMNLNGTGTVKPLLTVSNNIVLANNLSITGSSDGILSGIISGAGNLTKTGTGTLTLSGTNTYTGTTTITGGVLLLNSANALPGGIGTSGGTSNLTFNGPTSGTRTGVLGLGAGDFSRALGSGSNQVQWNGSGGFAAYGADRHVNIGGANASLSTGAPFFADSSSWFLILGAATADHTLFFDNGINWATGSAARTIQVDHGTAANGIDAEITGVISGSSTPWNKTGTGTLVLTNANTYTTATNINAGILNIQNGSALGTTAAGTTVASGATLQLQANPTNVNVGMEALTLNGTGASGQTGALVNVSGANTYGGAIFLNSDSTISSDGGTLNLNNTIDLSNPQQLTLAGASSGTVSGVISDGGNGGTLLKTGTGTWTLSGLNTYTGLTTVSAGILNIQNSGALGTTAAGTTVSSGATLQLQANPTNVNVGTEALTLNGGTASGQNGDLVNVSGTNSYAGAITLATAASTISSDAGALTLSGNISNSTFGLTLAGAGSGTVSGVIGNGSGTLAKTGAGTWTLSGSSSNTYTGLTTVSAGELDLGKTGTANAIGSGGLTISGGTVKYTGTSTDEIANTANVTISGGTLDLNNHADTIGSLTFNSGTLTSTGGTQTLTLAGSTATTLQMQGAATIPTSVNIAFSSTTTSGVGMTFDASANGTATINGNINLNSTATTGITRTFTINHGTAATDTTIAGVISNTTATGLTKAGAGTLVLTGANTYTGATMVNGGSLFVNGSGSIAAASAVTVNGSGTTLGGTGTINGTVNVAAGNNLSPGASGVNSVGKLNIGNTSTGALTLAATSNFNVDITGAGGVANAGITYDQANVTGTVNVTGSNLVLTVSGLTVANVGQSFFIVANDLTDAVTGMFAQGLTITSGSDVFAIHYSADTGTGLLVGGNDIALTLTAVVPEPSTWLAAALALGAVGYMQRRRLRELVRRLVIS